MLQHGRLLKKAVRMTPFWEHSQPIGLCARHIDSSKSTWDLKKKTNELMFRHIPWKWGAIRRNTVMSSLGPVKFPPPPTAKTNKYTTNTTTAKKKKNQRKKKLPFQISADLRCLLAVTQSVRRLWPSRGIKPCVLGFLVNTSTRKAWIGPVKMQILHDVSSKIGWNEKAKALPLLQFSH